MILRRSLLALGFAALAAAGCDTVSTQPVPYVPLDSLAISPGADTLQVGEARAFTVVAVDTNGVTLPSPSLSWRSTSPSVVTISRAGIATGRAEGSSLVIVSSGGLSDTALVIVLPQQAGWFGQISNTSFDLFAVCMRPDGNRGWAVGGAGRILRTLDAGTTWLGQASGTSFALNDVWFTSDLEGWAVGAGGTVLHTTNAGDLWTRVDAGASENLNGVTFATRDTGWAVGSSGVVLRTFDRGASWSRTHPTGSTLRGVAFAGTRDGWAVGDGGIVLGTHDRGLTWFTVGPAVTTQALRAVSRPTITSARAAGDQGVVPRTVAGTDSVQWELRNAGASFQLFGAFHVDTTLGFVVGVNAGVGAVLRTEDGGVTYTPQTANTQFRLNDVWFVDGLRGWAVGNNGSIVHTGTGGAP
jgi:photosystem II stability/assembly factor-like uncharacterized protein